MSDDFNYLSLNQNNDQNEPLISDNPIKENDSSNFVENLKTLSHCETKVIGEEEATNNINNKTIGAIATIGNWYITSFNSKRLNALIKKSRLIYRYTGI